jgi:hypothetical protein
MNDLQKFKEEMQKLAYGEESIKARKSGLCIDCGEPALANCYSEAGRMEVKISGLCEKCFDKLYQ